MILWTPCVWWALCPRSLCLGRVVIECERVRTKWMKRNNRYTFFFNIISKGIWFFIFMVIGIHLGHNSGHRLNSRVNKFLGTPFIYIYIILNKADIFVRGYGPIRQSYLSSLHHLPSIPLSSVVIQSLDYNQELEISETEKLHQKTLCFICQTLEHKQ